MNPVRQLLIVVLAVGATAQEPERRIAPYIPSPQSVVADMLELADVGPDDFVIDLGSGDGRIVLTAATVFGASGLGVEIRDELVERANQAAELAGVADRVTFVDQDLFDTDVSRATVLTMYLLPQTVNELRGKLLAELRPGARILSHDYPVEGWTPDRFVQLHLADKVRVTGVPTTNLYLYVVPANVAGRWRAQLPATLGTAAMTFEFDQQPLEHLSGSARAGGEVTGLEQVALRGDRLRFTLPGVEATFTGHVDGDRIEGVVVVDGAQGRWHARQETVTVTPPG